MIGHKTNSVSREEKATASAVIFARPCNLRRDVRYRRENVFSPRSHLITRAGGEQRD